LAARCVGIYLVGGYLHLMEIKEKTVKNRFLVGALLVGVIASTQTYAASDFQPGWYAGGGLGRTSVELDGGGQSFDYSTLGLTAGYQFNEIIGSEVMIGFSITDQKDRIASDVLDVDVNTEFFSFGAFVTAQSPGQFFVRGRLGLAESRFTYTAKGYEDEAGSDFGLAYGIGVGLKHNTMTVGFDYTALPDVDDPVFDQESYSANALGLSLTFSF
jgi:Outer membrane protein beta-barrel domain